MVKKYNNNYNEGCGCCYSSNTVGIDIKRKRIVLHRFNSHVGNFNSSCSVLAVIKVSR